MAFDEVLAFINARLSQLESALTGRVSEISSEVKSTSQQIMDALANMPDAIEPDLDDKAAAVAVVAAIADVRAEINAIKISLAGLDTRTNVRLTDLENRFNKLKDEMYVLAGSDVPSGPEEPSEPSEPIPEEPVPTPTPPILSPDAFIIPLQVRESANVDRESGLVSTGVPLAQDLQVRDVKDLVILDESWFAIAGDFRATAWWHDGSIQWVQCAWVTEIGAGKERAYRLAVKSGIENPKPDKSPDVRYINDSVLSVVCGEIIFYVASDGLFEQVTLVDSSGIEASIVDRSRVDLVIDQKGDILSTIARKINIEYLGPLVCIVAVETTAQSLAFGAQHDGTPGKIAVTKRYEFRAGSGIVIIDQALKWEGSKNGSYWLMGEKGPDVKPLPEAQQTLNAVLGELWSDKLTLASNPVDAVTYHSRDFAGRGTNLSIRQNLRSNRLQKRVSTSNVGGVISQKEDSSGSLIVASIAGIDVIVGLRQMGLNEPCELVLNGQNIEIQHVNDKCWIPFRSGMSSTCMVAVLSADDVTNVNELRAELDHPLRAFVADASYYSVGELGSVPTSELALSETPYDYHTAISKICNSTLSNIDRFGLYGRMTYAGIPRYWGTNDGGDEVGRKEGWDGALYGAFTDYYSTSRTATTLALMSGDSRWLDKLATPCAKRMLHTQINQSSPEDRWIYDGWASHGYSAYRSDFNSSHSYFEGLYWYYALSGDRQVVDILTKGQLRMIEHLSNPINPVEGRGAHQHLQAMRLLSHAHYDPKMRERFRAAFIDLMEKAIREQYIVGKYIGEEVHFWCGGKKKQAGENGTLNLYAMGIWDMESLWWYGKMVPQTMADGSPVLGHPHTILADLAQTTIKYGPLVVGGSGKFGFGSTEKWARGFKLTWEGFMGGTITNLAVQSSGGETLLYKGDEPGMASWLVRAAKISGDVKMKEAARNLVEYSIERIARANLPMGKLMGLGECRLMSAVAEMTEIG